jgi:hypothetical protein
MFASKMGHAAVVEALLNYGVSENEKTEVMNHKTRDRV